MHADRVSFRWKDAGSLESVLRKPIKAASLLMHGGIYPGVLSLWHADDTWLDIWTEMVDVREFCEVGVLVFSPTAQEPRYDLIKRFKEAQDIFEVRKLTIDEEPGIIAEAGIVLKTKRGTITIMGGSFPLTLAVQGLFDGPQFFDPEYEFDAYTVSEMSDPTAP